MKNNSYIKAIQNKTLFILVFEVEIGQNQSIFYLSTSSNTLVNRACSHSWSNEV